MDDSNIAGIEVCTFLGFCALIAGITLWVKSTNENYYGAINQCTQAGGMWIPSRDSGICVRR